MYIIYWDQRYFTSQLKQNPKHLAHYEKRTHWKIKCWNRCFERIHWSYVPALAGYRGPVSPALADWFHSSRRWSKIIYVLTFYLCDLIIRPNAQSAIQENLHTFRLRIQIVFSRPGRKEEGGAHHQIWNLHIPKTNCLHFQMHSVLQQKMHQEFTYEKTVSALWFLKKTCISEANNFAQKIVLTI
jgi:hypothetical protein